jgi:NAD(P)-dependent dehydrogenase (short-subunit alcohol dehydrogenase family)
LFARNGAGVVIADIDELGGTDTARLVEQEGGEAIALHVDVSRRTDCDAMVAATLAEFGRLDVLYNNAAIQMSGRLVDCTEEQWDLTVATNLNAIFWSMRAALPHMLAGRGGSVINTASTLGLIGSEGYAAYGAAKAGLIALTRQVAVEHGPTIRANVIAPGSIDTPRFRRVTDAIDDSDRFLEMLASHVPLRRIGTAEEVAEIALFLASDASAYVSGAVIPCDGGLAALR